MAGNNNLELTLSRTTKAPTPVVDCVEELAVPFARLLARDVMNRHCVVFPMSFGEA